MPIPMDQISRPLVVALIAVVGFAGAWMTVLRPKPGGEAAVNTAPAAAIAAPADRARGAVATANAAAASEQATGAENAGAPNGAAATRAAPAANDAAATNAGPAVHRAPAVKAAPAVKPAPTANAAPAVAAAPAVEPAAAKPVAPAFRPTVLLFAGTGADDAVARRVVRSIRAPGVRTIVTSIAHISRVRDLIGDYAPATTPTILVIGRDRKARVIEGLPAVEQVRQALAAVR